MERNAKTLVSSEANDVPGIAVSFDILDNARRIIRDTKDELRRLDAVVAEDRAQLRGGKNAVYESWSALHDHTQAELLIAESRRLRASRGGR